MTPKVFISYRREDSAGHAGRIHDRLAKELGTNLLFMDVDDMPLGVNFLTVLREEVAKCSVLLAVIGHDWLDVRDENGQRRLDNPNDFVRVEIAAALQREIPVIPILLEGTRVPSANQLPEDLQELSLRNGVFVRHSSFHNDMDRLIRGLGLQSGRADERPMTVSPASQLAKETMALQGRGMTPLAEETVALEGRAMPQKPAKPVPAKLAEPAKAAVSTPKQVKATDDRQTMPLEGLGTPPTKGMPLEGFGASKRLKFIVIASFLLLVGLFLFAQFNLIHSY